MAVLDYSALNESTVFASKNFILFAKDYLSQNVTFSHLLFGRVLSAENPLDSRASLENDRWGQYCESFTQNYSISWIPELRSRMTVGDMLRKNYSKLFYKLDSRATLENYNYGECCEN